MADNVLIDNGVLTDYTVATDDIGGIHYQRLKVTFGADGTASDVADTAPLPIYLPKAASATVTSVADSASAVTLAASNGSRKALLVFNDSASTLYVKFGSAAALSDYTVKVLPGGYYELPQPMYTGIVTGIWSADSTGAARVTEY